MWTLIGKKDSRKIYKVDWRESEYIERQNRFHKKFLYYQKIIGGYKEAIKNLNVSISNSELMYHTQTLRLAKEKVKKWTFLGLGLSGIITLLIIK